jgi:hypothetical protein
MKRGKRRRSVEGRPYIHANDAGLVQLLHHFFWWDSHRAYEQLGLLLDDDIDELVKVTFGVVVVGLPGSRGQGGDEQIHTKCCCSAESSATETGGTYEDLGS